MNDRVIQIWDERLSLVSLGDEVGRVGAEKACFAALHIAGVHSCLNALVKKRFRTAHLPVAAVPACFSVLARKVALRDEVDLIGDSLLCVGLDEGFLAMDDLDLAAFAVVLLASLAGSTALNPVPLAGV